MAVLFAAGSLCFTAGGLASQWASTSRPGIGVTFFVGSVFFTIAAYLQCAATQRTSSDWLPAVIQLAGTVLFNVSTFAAMNTALTTHEVNLRVWSPDVFGSIAFLISSGLAFAAVGHGWISFRPRSLSWLIAALNLLGSIAFGASAVAALIEPDSGEPVSARISNLGTAFGGLCFLAGALLLLMPQAAVSGPARAA
jgi:hypothetical protein